MLLTHRKPVLRRNISHRKLRVYRIRVDGEGTIESFFVETLPRRFPVWNAHRHYEVDPDDNNWKEELVWLDGTEPSWQNGNAPVHGIFKTVYP